jgi:hypothetical protein
MNFKSIIKIGFLLTLLLGTFLVAGCSAEELEEPISRNYETLTGEFITLGSVKVDKTITHMFETDEGEIYYAFSDRYDLDEEDNFGARIEAYGVVMEYESLDKYLFEVRRITEADEEEEEETSVDEMEYKDTDLGFRIIYPNNWTFEAYRDSITLTAPLAEVEDGEGSNDLEAGDPDYMVVANLGEMLSLDAEAENDEKSAAVQAYVDTNYDGLAGLTGQSSYVGVDRQFALKFKTDNGDISYFVPKSDNTLFELSFYHPAEEDGDKLDNSNIFAGIVNTFRFLPYEEEEIVEEEEITEEEEIVEEEVVEEEVVEEEVEEEEDSTPERSSYTTNVDQISVSKYLEFESNPYKFKISYPGTWYYSGGNGGYDFSDEPIEDDADPIIRLDMNVKSSEGSAANGNDVEVTVKIEDRYYTLSGPTEYQDVMEYMTSSITAVEEDEASE